MTAFHTDITFYNWATSYAGVSVHVTERRRADLCHLSGGVSFSAQVNHSQGWADAQRGDEDVPGGVCLAQSAQQIQGKTCVWAADGGHDWRRRGFLEGAERFSGA